MSTQDIINCWETGIEPYNATKETRDDYECIFILGSPDAPHLCYQCGQTREDHR